MKTFRLNITEIQYGFVEVKAENKDIAQDMYLDAYNEGKVTWTNSTISEVTAEEIANKTKPSDTTKKGSD